MSYIRDAIHNQVLISAALSWLIAQVLKVLIDGIRNGFCRDRRLPRNAREGLRGGKGAGTLRRGLWGMYDAGGLRAGSGETDDCPEEKEPEGTLRLSDGKRYRRLRYLRASVPVLLRQRRPAAGKGKYAASRSEVAPSRGTSDSGRRDSSGRSEELA